MWTHDDKKPMPHAHCKYCLGAIGTHRSDCPGVEIDRLRRALKSANSTSDTRRRGLLAAEAKIARVEALADGPNQPGAWVSSEDEDAPAAWVTHLRAALDGYRIAFSTRRAAYVREPLDGSEVDL